MTIKQSIHAQARQLGFSAIGFTTARLPSRYGTQLDAFIAQGQMGDMDWLAARAEQRRSPDALWPDARSVISLAVNYGPDHHPLDKRNTPTQGNIAAYAYGRDYHDLIKKQLRALASWIATTYACDVKIFVDTAPVLEKPIAQQAGLGWQGKHTNVVSREFGSWLFLAEIFTTLELEPDTPHTDHCGACRSCIDICPTGAIIAPYQLDARRCISYLTIEHKGHIPADLRPLMGNHIYGCDDCLAVCPWNKFAKSGNFAGLEPRADNHLPDLATLVQLDDSAFRARFSGSPIKRTGRARFVRNVLIAIGNSAEPSFVPLVIERLSDESELVRAAAIWALRQLDPTRFAAEQHRKAQEPDSVVAQEWQQG